MTRSLLVIPGYRLYPIETGAGLAQYVFIDGLRKDWHISLLLDDSNVRPEFLTELREEWEDVEFLAWKDLRHTWEEYASSSMSYKLKRKFTSSHVVEPIPTPWIPEQMRDVWKNVSIVYYQPPEWREASLAFFLKKRHFDIVQTDLPCNLSLTTCVPRASKSLHICHEVKYKRFESSAHLMAVPDSQTVELLSKLKIKELQLLDSFDYCLCFSDEDKEAIDSGSDSVMISPFPVLDKEFHSGSRPQPVRLMFLGPEHHGPNKEGLEWFLRTIWNQADLQMKLHVIGDWSDETIARLSQDNVSFEGFVDDLSPFFHDSIMIVPILSGAGIRTKILQAMAQKVPVLSTRFGAQGIPVEDRLHIGFFDNPLEFIEKLTIFLDREQREKSVILSQAVIKEHFSQLVLGSLRSNLLHAMLDSK